MPEQDDFDLRGWVVALGKFAAGFVALVACIVIVVAAAVGGAALAMAAISRWP